MKRLLPLLFAAACVLVSCSRKTDVRTPEDIFKDIMTAVADSTADPAGTLPLFSEYADSLYSIVEHSGIGDLKERLSAQKLAAYGLFLALDYYHDGADIDIDDVAMKFTDVSTIWKVKKDEDRTTYYKDTWFVEKKDTEKENDTFMTIAVEDSDEPSCGVLLPEDAQRPIITFADGEIDPDIDSSVSFAADTCEGFGDGHLRMYIFEGSRVLDMMLSHDVMFLTYPTDDGGHESTMTLLRKFRGQYEERP